MTVSQALSVPIQVKGHPAKLIVELPEVFFIVSQKQDACCCNNAAFLQNNVITDKHTHGQTDAFAK